ncbi:MAG: DUF4124 domain-containing protein [Burkholderiaceae bacterium]
MNSFSVAAATLGALLALVPSAAHALFKVIGPDGRVTYTDRAPQAAEGRAMPVSRETGRASDPALPFALRQVASRFPVTLYTMKDCGEACALGRALLAKRGVPYIERVAETNEDRDSWARIVGGTEAPVLKVGEQSLRSYAPVAWEETLDVAGYPRTSLLPANYSVPAPVPFGDRKASAPVPSRTAPSTAPAAVDPAANPTGIRF